MRQSKFERKYAIVTLVIIAVIIYGSLYPFDFRVPQNGIGPLRTFLDSWADKPGRGDFLSNILLYMPLGFFAIHVIRRDSGWWLPMVFAVVLGSALSLAMELTQYYDEGRDTAVSDFYSNALGTLLGAIAGRVMGGNIRGQALREAAGNRVPLMFLTAWVAYRLFPYVPTIDLHKYWDTLKPIVLHPSLTPYDLFRHTAIWLTVGTLIDGVVGPRRSWWAFPLFVAGVLFAKILIIDATLSVAEILGGVLALVLWFALGASARLRLTCAALLLGAYVVAARLEPFHFLAQAGSFNWIPFFGLMEGSIEVDVLSFLEKFFLYGSLVWLFTQAGLRLRFAAIMIAAILLATSWAEIYLPGRSAEITDALMALLIGVVIALMGPERRAAA
jgi:VanZ family protein